MKHSVQRRHPGLLLLLALLLALLAKPVAGQEAIQVLSQSIESEFRDNITASLSARGTAEITDVEFFYRLAGQKATTRNDADFEPGTEVEAQFVIDQTSIYFPPGTELEYWWKLTDADGNTLRTDRQMYLYLDNRYDFQVLQNERLSLYWYRGGEDFGQTLFDRANEALDRLEQDVGVTVEDPIKIFIYGSHSDLLNAIAVGAQEWTGGQAFAENGVVVMGIAPDNLDWGLKATVHEMTHLVIHQATDNPYGDLPRWLDEGLAVYNEDPERLDFQFRSSFDRAVRDNELMTLQTLSSTFPADPEAANLAYGESGAIVKFILDTYGPEAMANLLDIFAEGALYDDALEEALGVDMHTLDNQWRASLGLPPLPDFQPAGNVAPSPAPPTAAPATGATPASPQETAQPVVTPEAVAPSPAEPAPAPTSGLLFCVAGLLCLAGLGVLVGGGGWLLLSRRRKSTAG
ncbi:MAG: hypothetical protein D6796_12975 [Caldilineae bacterium]|nr:MAG: hypothetical protein D6796_12975 [Caldilineae bacterium]